jgi:hypothetical protein
MEFFSGGWCAMPGSLDFNQVSRGAMVAPSFRNGGGMDDALRLSRAAVTANLLVAIHRACPARQDFHLLSTGFSIPGPGGEELWPSAAVVQGQIGLGRCHQVTPIVIVDVCEGDPADHDGHQRRDSYTAVPSLQAYFAASCTEKLVEIHRRFSGSWTSLRFEGHGLVGLPSLGCSVDLKTIYAGLF